MNGASLRVDLTQPGHEANIKSVFAQLPLAAAGASDDAAESLSSRDVRGRPDRLPSIGAQVGNATVVTPVLPSPLKGSAYLVSTAAPPSPIWIWSSKATTCG